MTLKQASKLRHDTYVAIFTAIDALHLAQSSNDKAKIARAKKAKSAALKAHGAAQRAWGEALVAAKQFPPVETVVAAALHEILNGTNASVK